MNSPDPLKDMLRFDPLAEAERLTGVSIHNDNGKNAAMAIGVRLMQEHATAKEALLRERGDTIFHNELDRYLDVIEAADFERVLELDCPKSADKYLVYARRDGLLLAFDTYNVTAVNGGRVLYNWRPACGDERWSYTSSGHMHDDVWIGDHDCREALLYNLDRLAANGDFVTPWVERPFLWLLSYADSKVEGYDYKAINRSRVAMLPEWVQTMIGPET